MLKQRKEEIVSALTAKGLKTAGTLFGAVVMPR